MTTRLTAVLIAVLATAACGDSPVAPTPAQSATVATSNTQPAPPAPPPAPTPAPAPTPGPAPTPAPAPPPPGPAPQPEPDAAMRYDATTRSFHWYSDPWFGDTFVVERYKDRVLVNGRALPIAVVSSDTYWTARSADATFVANGTSWTFNGLAGQATGSLEKR